MSKWQSRLIYVKSLLMCKWYRHKQRTFTSQTTAKFYILCFEASADRVHYCHLWFQSEQSGSQAWLQMEIIFWYPSMPWASNATIHYTELNIVLYVHGTQCTVGLSVYCAGLPRWSSNIVPLSLSYGRHYTISPNTITFTFKSTLHFWQILQPLVIVKSVRRHKGPSNWFITYYW